jgi:hypothetical protein
MAVLKFALDVSEAVIDAMQSLQRIFESQIMSSILPCFPNLLLKRGYGLAKWLHFE